MRFRNFVSSKRRLRIVRLRSMLFVLSVHLRKVNAKTELRSLQLSNLKRGK